ncbi:DUF1989 domain-containing protein [Silvanigrella aquatica]|uniref:DUF1989 domain-containing protein n=1 Tax=Silvanigrella aquatica TaxID=1915309 RepID=UPI000B1251C8|nr:aminomethyltransferase family protein [Silvanigrella aquatica]
MTQERYRIKPREGVLISLFDGDQFSIIDPEGGQVCEVLAFDNHGKDALKSINLKGELLSKFAQELLFSSSQDEATGLFLRQNNIDLNQCRSAKILGENLSFRNTGSKKEIFVNKSIVCILFSPAFPMEISEQNPGTEILINIDRNKNYLENEKFNLPPPFFEVKFEQTIQPGSAISYEVKSGDYIQIIDVAGKQCSDFLAFDHIALNKREELGIDLAATRTFMGLAYPVPGLYSKFYDKEFQPLFEIIRDTVGKHDSFVTACSAKYYEDQGYPGHKNCSDNFNSELQKYSIKSRPGWPAINFFYNTSYDKNAAQFVDEPWSRPGDYILLRAMKDLVCASSSCPDDIDPANGWNPTDIHIRVYSPQKTISKGIAYRMMPDSIPQLTHETAFHPRTSLLTKSYTDYRNFWLPTCFTGFGPIEEYYACRENAALIDLSALRKFEILGPDAETLLQKTLTRNIRKMSVGQVVYTAMCHETGGMLDDGTLFRLGMNGFRWICGSDYSGVWLREQTQKMGLQVSIKSSISEIHNIAVQGPKSREILKEIIWTKADQPTVQELKWFRFTIGRIGDDHGVPLIISRTGYSGELGYEIWCHPQHALKIWDAVWEQGNPRGMVPLGFSALDMLRIESGLIFAGYDFDDQIDPFEAGIGFTVALDKEDDFIGKEALIKRKKFPQKILVGLELEGNEAAVHGDCVHLGRNQIGIITSATRSPILRKNIALCRIAVEFSDVGTLVEVGKLDGHQKRIKAKIVKFPFYDPEKIRPRS